MRTALTKRQAEMLAWIEQFTIAKGYQPSTREVGTHFGITPPAVAYHVAAICKKGWLESTGNARALVFVGGPPWTRRIEQLEAELAEARAHLQAPAA